MAYSQWIEVKIVSENVTLDVKNASLSWGKFYEAGDKNKEVSTEDINKIKVESGKTALICSCGRSGSATGTEGSFDLYDGDTKIGKFYWDCPFNKKTNNFSWTVEKDIEKYYFTRREGGNKDSGAIGNVTITCIKL